MQNRRKYLVETAFAASAIALLKPLNVVANSLESVTKKGLKRLTIVFSSDLASDGKTINSNDTFSTNIKAIKYSVQDIISKNYNVLLLQNGNICNPKKVEEEIVTQRLLQLKSLGYDAIVAGKNDIKSAKSFNSLAAKTGLTVLGKNTQIIEKGKIKIGLVANDFSETSTISGIKRKAALLSNKAKELKEQHNCNLVICLSTNNIANNKKAIKNDMDLTTNTHSIDLIISGNNFSNKPIQLTTSNLHKEAVLLTSNKFIGTSIGRIDIDFDKNLQKNKISLPLPIYS